LASAGKRMALQMAIQKAGKAILLMVLSPVGNDGRSLQQAEREKHRFSAKKPLPACSML